MTPRPSSLDFSRPKSPNSPCAQSTILPVARALSDYLRSPSGKSARNPSNRAWVQEQQRKVFVHHLEKWSANHDSSPHFHGRISFAPKNYQGGEDIGLGKSVTCVLTDTTFTDARRKIVIRLFPPQEYKMHGRRASKRHVRHDSLDLFDADLEDIRRGKPVPNSNGPCFEQKERNISNGCYKLVVRCGAGWMSARDYFSKVYFNSRSARETHTVTFLHKNGLNNVLASRSQHLGPPPSAKDTVSIHPLFHPFRRLPIELQEMILLTAAGISKGYNLCSDTHLYSGHIPTSPSPINLSTLLRISGSLNKHLLPYIYHSTDFHFGLTGFTNFLWQSGPINRPEIRRLTFHFGKLALLHCIRWLAPEHVFELLGPPVVTTPRSLQYFWRCQIQDLAREVKLLSLTVDLRNIPTADVPMVVRILKSVFGGVQYLRFIVSDREGATTTLNLDDERLQALKEGHTWRQLCAGYFERHKRHQYFSKWDLLRLESEDLEALMDKDKERFDQ